MGLNDPPEAQGARTYFIRSRGVHVRTLFDPAGLQLLFAVCISPGGAKIHALG